MNYGGLVIEKKRVYTAQALYKSFFILLGQNLTDDTYNLSR